MESHRYDFQPTEVLRLLAWPLASVAAFALAMHGGARTGLLPAPRPTLDGDRTVLIHQAEAARSSQDASVLLVGDSSCLMDVSARQLTDELGRAVLNLGTLSYVDLETQALLVRAYHRANPGRLGAVVLLMHPETLRRAPSDSWQAQALRRFLAGADYAPLGQAGGSVARGLGVHIFQGRLLARLLPRPLPGPFGRRYGFTTDLERFLAANRGSAVDPEFRPPSGRAEYRLASGHQAACAVFRQALPAEARLFVGITPVPQSFVGEDYSARHHAMLVEWASWLKADAALTELPATLPDALFAQKTHLNETGQRAYTARLMAALRRHGF